MDKVEKSKNMIFHKIIPFLAISKLRRSGGETSLTALVKRRQRDGLKVACKHGAYVIKLCAVGEVYGAVGKILGNTAEIRTEPFKAAEYLNMKTSPAERVAERKNVKMTGIKDRFGRACPQREVAHTFGNKDNVARPDVNTVAVRVGKARRAALDICERDLRARQI